MPKYKQIEVSYSDEGNGTIEGYASTWIRKPDSYGDIVAPGAFTETLKNRYNGGVGIPFLWSHQMGDIESYIGTATADEDEKGLHFIATFDDTKEAQRVRQLYKDGRLRKFSFAYDILEAAEVKLEDGQRAYELRKLDLYEISAVCVPANDDAGVVDVKARRRRCKTDKLKEAVNLINGFVDEFNEDDEADDEDEPDGKAAAEDSMERKSKAEEVLKYIEKIERK
ncbi:MAG: HK97 family phage prohead protease [Bacteroidales bacterium]|nr:HK97 family phage prohead protease [Bacteroidales bacterium]